jgi:hypothetical protein
MPHGLYKLKAQRCNHCAQHFVTASDLLKHMIDTGHDDFVSIGIVKDNQLPIFYGGGFFNFL